MSSIDVDNTLPTDASHGEQDLGPLAWVLDELRKSLDAAVKSLRRFVHDAEVAQESDLAALDASSLRMARQQLHQASGALEMVGMAAPALVLRAMESAVQRYVQRPELCTDEAAAVLERASFALSEYLDSVLTGKTVSAVALFPQYRDVQALAGVDRVHPADLWPAERRFREPATAVDTAPVAYGVEARARLDQAVLKIVKEGSPDAARDLRNLSLGLAAAQSEKQPRAFWKICAGFFEAFAQGLFVTDLYVKRVASRVLMQYATLAKGDPAVGDRLVQDLLFFCAQARHTDAGQAPALQAVRGAFALDRFAPVDYEERRFGRFDPVVLAQARKRIATATETWSALAGGDRNKLKPAADQFSLVCDSLRKLHRNSESLAQAMTRALDATIRSAEPPSAALAMEVATSVLYLQAAFEELDTADEHMTHRANRLAERLDSVRAGAEPEPLEPWMEELYRRVSDHQTMGSVVDELRVTLGEAERSMDQFFRKPEDTSPLKAVPGQLAQMRGVLSVLGLDQASMAVVRMRDTVERLLINEVQGADERSQTFEKLGNSLGALGFLIDMLSYQRTLARKLFVYDEELGELRSLMGRTRARATDEPEEVEHVAQERAPTPLPEVVARTPAVEPVPALAPAPVPVAPAASIVPAAPVMPAVSDVPVAQASAPLEVATGPTDLPVESLSLAQAPMPVPAPVAPPIPQPVSVPRLDVDDELLEVFLEEAREVVVQGLGAVQQLHRAPGDLSEQTTLRRAFHTLKGSSRMVGLNEFGEAAWSMEQLLNAWLAEQKPMQPPLLQLAQDALQGFGRWAEDIASGGDFGVWHAEAFRASADAMRQTGTVLPLVLPGVSAPDAVLAPAPVAVPEEPSLPLDASLSLESPSVQHEFAIEQLAGMPALPEETNQEVVPATADGHSVGAIEVADDAWNVPFDVMPEPAAPEALSTADTAFVQAPAEEIDFAEFTTALDMTEPLPEVQPVVEAPPLLVGSEPLPVLLPEDFGWEPSVEAFAEPANSLESPAQEITPEEIAPEQVVAEGNLLELPLAWPDAVVSELEVAPALPPEVAFEPEALAAPEEPFAPQEAVPETAFETVAVAEPEMAQEPEKLAVPEMSFAEVVAPESTLAAGAVAEPEPEPELTVEASVAPLAVQPEMELQAAAEPQPVPPENTAPVQDSMPAPLEDAVKVIGTLRIGIPLYNVYLNEADEWSRRLAVSLQEWSLELHEPLPNTAVALAHSLAGSSATVGFMALSETARLLEHALSHVQLQSCGEPAQAQVFIDAAEDIRRLLHQFAAGFLKQANVQVQDALRQILQTEVANTLTPPLEDALAALEELAAQEEAYEAEMQAERARAAAELLVAEPEPTIAALVPVPDIPTSGLVPSADHAAVKAAPQDVDDDIDVLDVIDPDLFPIFEDEAAELLPRLGAALRQWSARPDNLGARNEVLRSLHTLKGSSRLAGAMRLGEMAHRLESAIEQLDMETVGVEHLEPLLGQLDALQANFDALRSISAQAPAEAVVVAPVPEPAAAGGTAMQVATPITGMPRLQGAVQLAPLRTAAHQSVRVRAQLLDRLVNQAGEVMITRSRLEARLGQFKSSLGDMSVNLDKLRQQLRDIEMQSESQMQSRLALAKDSAAGFDPLEFDRFTRVQELTRMMAESVNDVATVQRNLQRAMDGAEDDLIAQGRQARELQRDLLRTRMVEFEGIAERLYAVVRQSSKEMGKQIKLDITGGSIEMDRGVLDRMTPAFEHLLRNCVAHGIESPEERAAMGKPPVGTIAVALRHEGNDVSVEFRDDGAGLNLARIRAKALEQGLIAPDAEVDDAQAANLIFMPGFTTVTTVTGIAGRGIGMDVVRSEIKALGGRIETTTQAGQGTAFRMVLPLTTAVTQVVMLRAGDLSFGVPANLVEVVRRTPAADLEQAYRSGTFDVAAEKVPFYWAGGLLQASRHSQEPAGKTRPVVVFRSASQRVAMHVDEVLGNQEVVVKNLGPQLARLPGLAGMSVLASGAVVLIYNPVALSTVYGDQVRAAALSAPAVVLPTAASADAGRVGVATPSASASQVPLVLVVDDSITVRRVTQRLLQREGYRVALAADGLQALERLQEERPTVVLSDIEMPRMDGFDLARNIRGDEALRDLPIIMITSRIAEKHREHAMELGVNHYLGKPYSDEELLSLVQHYARLTTEAVAA